MEYTSNNNHADQNLVNKEDIEKQYRAARMYKEKMITRLFTFMIELLFIFLIPALIALFVIKQYGIAIYIALPLAFILSWLIAWVRYRGYRDQMKDADNAFKKAKEQYDTHFPKETAAVEGE